MNNPKIGDTIITQNKDEYRIVSIEDNGYLVVKPAAYIRAGISGGEEMIHKTELEYNNGYWKYLG